MVKMINVTDARGKLGQIVDLVALSNQKYIFLKDSQPKAVLIPYVDFAAQEENWQKEMLGLMDKYNKKSVYKDEDEALEAINKMAGRG